MSIDKIMQIKSGHCIAYFQLDYNSEAQFEALRNELVKALLEAWKHKSSNSTNTCNKALSN